MGTFELIDPTQLSKEGADSTTDVKVQLFSVTKYNCEISNMNGCNMNGCRGMPLGDGS